MVLARIEGLPNYEEFALAEYWPPLKMPHSSRDEKIKFELLRRERVTRSGGLLKEVNKCGSRRARPFRWTSTTTTVCLSSVPLQVRTRHHQQARGRVRTTRNIA